NLRYFGSSLGFSSSMSPVRSPSPAPIRSTISGASSGHEGPGLVALLETTSYVEADFLGERTDHPQLALGEPPRLRQVYRQHPDQLAEREHRHAHTGTQVEHRGGVAEIERGIGVDDAVAMGGDPAGHAFAHPQIGSGEGRPDQRRRIRDREPVS